MFFFFLHFFVALDAFFPRKSWATLLPIGMRGRNTLWNYLLVDYCVISMADEYRKSHFGCSLFSNLIETEKKISFVSLSAKDLFGSGAK